jgi:hypothetical protein
VGPYLQDGAACSHYDDLESVASEIKLKSHIAVHRDEQFKASFFGLLEQYPLLDSGPIQSSDRFDLMPCQAQRYGSPRETRDLR